jgi:hypothetical protein
MIHSLMRNRWAAILPPLASLALAVLLPIHCFGQSKSLFAPAEPQAAPASNTPEAQVAPCGQSYGTALTWASSPPEAGKLAKTQNKLVFVMHISGNFAREEFT